MLKRLWRVLSLLWAFVFIADGLTKEHGLQPPDLGIAGAPLVGAAALAAIARYIVTDRGRTRRYRVD